MSMLALPESECQEILALFRQHLPHVPDAWLQDMAANYGQDAVVDIDPNDVIDILSRAGKLHRILLPLLQYEPPENVHRRMHSELTRQGIRADRIAASLLTIRGSSAKLADIGNLACITATDCMSNARKGWAWYSPMPVIAGGTLTWIFRCSV